MRRVLDTRDFFSEKTATIIKTTSEIEKKNLPTKKLKKPKANTKNF